MSPADSGPPGGVDPSRRRGFWNDTRVRGFLHLLGADRVSLVGAVLATTSFLAAVLFFLLALGGGGDNPYTGIVGFFLLPGLFLLGLLLVAAGFWRLRRRIGFPGRNIFSSDFLERSGHARDPRGVAGVIGLLTLLNLGFFLVAGSRALHTMDSPTFCGTTCHHLMIPEYTAWQSSPHARVICVECHVGEGTGALLESKLNGAWQVVSMALHLYEKPIPTPVRQLRPARETCERCHWPEKFIGDKLITRARYAPDSVGTPSFVSLNLKIGSGDPRHAHGIHWHVAENTTVRYRSLGDEREVITWVEWTRPDGRQEEYWRDGYGPSPGLEGSHRREEGAGGEEIRTMDCVDCHNRATHIYEDPSEAIDRAMTLGDVSADLPWIKREARAALTRDWPDRDAGATGIAAHLEGFYRTVRPEMTGAERASLDRSIAATQAVFLRNIHPSMNVGWNPHPDHLGHRRSLGCFRCHSREMRTAGGVAISHECTLCHSILANESPRPLAYLEPVPGPDSLAAAALREEFFRAGELEAGGGTAGQGEDE